MAKEHKKPFWQICIDCDQRTYSAEEVHHECPAGGPGKMTDARIHPDNNAKPETASPKAKTPTTSP